MQTFTGIEYIKIDIASAFGLDKEDWNIRLQWFDNNEPQFSHQFQAYLDQAEEPARFFSGVQAYYTALAGHPIGFMISLDATSSGLQILAALTGDRQASQICNVVNTGHREDAYSSIYFEMLNRTGGSAQINRSQSKEAVMTSLYGSTAMPKRIFGEGELLTVFYDTMEDNAPAAWELNQAMLAMWDPEALSNDWVLPDNFHVHIKIMDKITETVNFYEEPFQVTHKVNKSVEQGRSLGANMVHSIDGMIVRELTRRCDFDPQKIAQIRQDLAAKPQRVNLANLSYDALSDDDRAVITLWDRYNESGYLSARILDHLNGWNLGHVDPTVLEELLDTLPKRPFKVVSVHDCFRCLPHYGNDLRYQYALQLHLIARSDLLQSLLSQIQGRHVPIGKLDPTLPQDILATDYALS